MQHPGNARGVYKKDTHNGGPMSRLMLSTLSFLVLAACATGAGKVEDEDDDGTLDWGDDVTPCDALDAGTVAFPAGRFWMGSPSTEAGREADEHAREVTLTRDFLLGETEVTQAEFQSLMGSDPSAFGDCADCPVEQVTWHEAAAYANARSTRDGLEECYSCEVEGTEWVCDMALDTAACQGWRLPTEAEWEYAARDGGDGMFPDGGELVSGADVTSCSGNHSFVDGSRLGEWGWYCGNSGQQTNPVMDRAPTATGLYGMVGNVREWVQDGYEPRYGGEDTGFVDPTGDPASGQRVRKGGSWYSRPADARIAHRAVAGADDRYDIVGFRVARTCVLDSE